MERGDFPGTPTKATSFPGDPTMSHPYYLTPGTSTEIILNHPSASASVTDSCYPPRQSLPPRTPAAAAAAAAADLHEINLLPSRTRNQAPAGIILCLPAQQTRSKTKKSRTIPKNPPPQNLERPKQLTRDETRRMLMDKARTEITCYLDQ